MKNGYKLKELKEKACGENSENMLIHGDNLHALNLLLPKFRNKIKFIYIDPPYNTGSVFGQYDDNKEHNVWLKFMEERLTPMRELLSEDGCIFVQIDDNEQAYLKILMDKIFGRENYCGQFVWEKKKKPSFLNPNMGVITEYILVFAKNRTKSPAFVYGTTTKGKKYPINNAGNGIRKITFPPKSVQFKCKDQTFLPQDMSGGNIITKLLTKLVVKNGLNQNAFTLLGEWRYSQAKINEIIKNGETIVISKAPFRPNHIKTDIKPKKIKNLLSAAHYNMATNEDAAEESRKIFGVKNCFDYPKPEKLIYCLMSSATKEGDTVLDGFLGSGTTAAVAAKTKRKWIGIEQGNHCYTHCYERLKKVIAGNDNCGISEETDWHGGGGFKFYEVEEV